MTFKTKFDIGEAVWALIRDYRRCEHCGQSLPKQSIDGDAWKIVGPMVIAYIAINASAHYSSDSPLHQPFYAFERRESDPIGIGRAPEESDLFRSEAEAVAECLTRNAPKPFLDFCA